jgi:ribonuclease G
MNVTKDILVNVGEREIRIAVLEDGKLAELHIEREERSVGSIYKGRVENVVRGMDAAFVDIGLARNAFLYVGDVIPDSGDQPSGGLEEEDEDDVSEVSGEAVPAGRSPQRRGGRSIRRSVLRQQRIDEVLKSGQEVLVQVTKGPRGTKGARISTRVSLPGRYLVLMPDADNVGISRKITDNRERDRLRKIGEKMRLAGYGIIIRTESEDKTEEELFADRDQLVSLWRDIQEKSRKVRAPSCVYQDLSLVSKSVRDLFGSDVHRLFIDDPVEYERAHEMLSGVSPKLRGRVQLYTGEKPLFDEFGIEPEIEKSLKRKVWLRSGGYLIIDVTEALTVIDVNTGKFTGGGSLAETIVKTNIDAASEVARQLRLRDIGGIIVIDFIDMNNARDKQSVIRALENALKRDRARTKISTISPLGLVEMTRKRTAETIMDFLGDPCPYCSGRGQLPSAESVSINLERELRKTLQDARRSREAVSIVCHPSVAEIVIGEDGDNVDRLERELQCAIFVRSNPELHIEKFDIQPGELVELERRLGGIRRQQVVDCTIANSALQGDGATVGWTNGLLLELNDAKRFVDQRMKARILEVRRSYAVAAVVPGTASGSSPRNQQGAGVV